MPQSSSLCETTSGDLLQYEGVSEKPLFSASTLPLISHFLCIIKELAEFKYLVCSLHLDIFYDTSLISSSVLLLWRNVEVISSPNPNMQGPVAKILRYSDAQILSQGGIIL